MSLANGDWSRNKRGIILRLESEEVAGIWSAVKYRLAQDVLEVPSGIRAPIPLERLKTALDFRNDLPRICRVRNPVGMRRTVYNLKLRNRFSRVGISHGPRYDECRRKRNHLFLVAWPNFRYV